MSLIGEHPLPILLFQNDNEMIAVFKEEWGEHPVPVYTFGFNANLIAHFLPEILRDCLDRHLVHPPLRKTAVFRRDHEPAVP